ncbi:hypothetical protein [Chitinophaga varians]|uniref:hypothetical protein n=1 Tax=Chitinophaga varians TaxID=2202339 RepID=UPI00165FD8F0|nr:hypothetical protein [Chitinophaga varians]MBC9914022.1 hypothetical protein [Chitinophaga varians]
MKIVCLVGIFSLLILVSGCYRYARSTFLEKYADEDFSPFKNIYILNRDYDPDKHTSILFVFDEREDGPYVVRVNSTLGKIVGTSTHMMDDARNPDSILKQQLALKFMQYHISALDVDSVGNVRVWMKHEHPDLIRVSNVMNIPEYNRSDYKKIKGNWYVNTEW